LFDQAFQAQIPGVFCSALQRKEPYCTGQDRSTAPMRAGNILMNDLKNRETTQTFPSVKTDGRVRVVFLLKNKIK
jgi:hypothetical protein